MTVTITNENGDKKSFTINNLPLQHYIKEEAEKTVENANAELEAVKEELNEADQAKEAAEKAAKEAIAAAEQAKLDAEEADQARNEAKVDADDADQARNEAIEKAKIEAEKNEILENKLALLNYNQTLENRNKILDKYNESEKALDDNLQDNIKIFNSLKNSYNFLLEKKKRNRKL